MALPVTCVNVCVRDRISAVDHHPVANIDSHMGSPCRVVRKIDERDREYYFRDMKVDFPYTLRQE